MTPPQWGELAEEERAREESSWRPDGLPLTSRKPSRGRERGPTAALLKLVQLCPRRCTDVYLSRARSPPQSAVMQFVETSKLRDLPPEKGCLLQGAQIRCDGKPGDPSHPHENMPTPRTGRRRGGGRRARPGGGPRPANHRGRGQHRQLQTTTAGERTPHRRHRHLLPSQPQGAPGRRRPSRCREPSPKPRRERRAIV